MPPDAMKGLIGDMQPVVPICLVTHPWTAKAYVEHPAALLSRAQTGHGVQIDCNLFESQGCLVLVGWWSRLRSAWSASMGG
ncbi:hypothetical protein BV25DRAFT_1922489 [Artomyces pyxidatus]|uniref:Uncharacterized protein n=1 Tax=Artomyces pyxidatus TaxID=48021 RepID=A0ACB8SDP6_9AGAM|nr:hypothetical protein BV25DRAFT_1922489 [Artomyces pyxidatus]